MWKQEKKCQININFIVLGKLKEKYYSLFNFINNNSDLASKFKIGEGFGNLSKPIRLLLDLFDYDKFYEWCIKMSQHNIVLISEYYMPNDKFECIWAKDTKVMIDSNKINGSIRTEKLFKVKE